MQLTCVLKADRHKVCRFLCLTVCNLCTRVHVVLCALIACRYAAAYIISVSSCAVNQRDVFYIDTCLYKHHNSSSARSHTHMP